MADENTEKVELTNSGVSWFKLSIRRGTLHGPLRSIIGLTLHVHADPMVEKFMQTYSNDQKIDVSAIGALWVPTNPEQSLEVYKFRKNFPVSLGGGSNLNYPGSGLLLNEVPDFEGPQGPNGLVANLALLRIVGISRPEGVQFGLSGPYSKQYVKSASSAIIAEVRKFIEEYLTPINVNLRITSQS